MDVCVWALRPELNLGCCFSEPSALCLSQDLSLAWNLLIRLPGRAASPRGLLCATVPSFLWLQGLELRSSCLQDRHFTFRAVSQLPLSLYQCSRETYFLCFKWFMLVSQKLVPVWCHFYCLCFPVTSLWLSQSLTATSRGGIAVCWLWLTVKFLLNNCFVGDACWVTWDFLSAWEELSLTPGVAVEKQWVKGSISSHIIEAAIGRNRGF